MSADFQDTQSCQVGDAGVALVIAVVDAAGSPVDLRPASAMTVRLSRPDGSVLPPKSAAWFTDGSDGKMVYATAAGDLDKAGRWKIQGAYTISGAAKSTEVVSFNVKANLQA